MCDRLFCFSMMWLVHKTLMAGVVRWVSRLSKLVTLGAAPCSDVVTLKLLRAAQVSRLDRSAACTCDHRR